MAKLYDLDGQPLAWAELEARREAYYAEREKRGESYLRWVAWQLDKKPWLGKRDRYVERA